MKPLSYLCLSVAWLLGVSVAEEMLAFPDQTFSKLAKNTSSLLIAQSEPYSRDFPSFFETGRLRSQDRLRLQSPPPDTMPVSPQSQSWQFIIFQAGNSSFWMPPGILTEENVTLETSLGPVSFRTLASNSEDRRYVVAYANQLTEAQLNSPQVLLKAIQEKVAPANQFQLNEKREITLNNYPGRELTFENAEEVITFRVYLVGKRVHALGVRYPKANPLPRQTRGFLNAFELLK